MRFPQDRLRRCRIGEDRLILIRKRHPPFPEKKIVLIYILKVPSVSNFIWTSAEELGTLGEAAQVNRACPFMEG